MINWLINGGLFQPEYGVTGPMYGPPTTSLYGVPSNPGRVFWQYFLAFVFLILIPVILLVGVLAFAKKKQFSKKERIWSVVVVLGIYFAVLIGVVLTIGLVFI